MGLWDIAPYIARFRYFALANVCTSYTLSHMKRTTIFLTPDQIKRLDKAARKKGIKPAQLIRMYINAGLAKEKP